MPRFTMALLFGGTLMVAPLPQQDPVYAPLWLYRGTWEVRKEDTVAGSGIDRLTDDCALIGKYFACQQTVNGKIGPLTIFLPTDKFGHYYTQVVLPEGWAVGRGELDIVGEHWTYSGKSVQDGKSTFHRTTNVFTGTDRIHFEVAESFDGEHGRPSLPATKFAFVVNAANRSSWAVRCSLWRYGKRPRFLPFSVRRETRR